MDVLLALGEPDGPPGGDGLDDLREPVEDTAGVAELPRPTGLGREVGAALRELLVGGAAHVEQVGAVLVHVAVDGDGRTVDGVYTPTVTATALAATGAAAAAAALGALALLAAGVGVLVLRRRRAA